MANTVGNDCGSTERNVVAIVIRFNHCGGGSWVKYHIELSKTTAQTKYNGSDRNFSVRTPWTTTTGESESSGPNEKTVWPLGPPDAATSDQASRGQSSQPPTALTVISWTSYTVSYRLRRNIVGTDDASSLYRILFYRLELRRKLELLNVTFCTFTRRIYLLFFITYGIL